MEDLQTVDGDGGVEVLEGEEVRGSLNSGSSGTGADPCHRVCTAAQAPHAKLWWLHRQLGLTGTLPHVPYRVIHRLVSSTVRHRLSVVQIDCIESTSKTPLDISYGVSTGYIWSQVAMHPLATALAKTEGLNISMVEVSNLFPP